MRDPQLLEYLYQALAARCGIVISTDNPNLLRQRLYQTRKEAGDADLAILQIRNSPVAPDTELWIVKGAKPNGKA